MSGLKNTKKSVQKQPRRGGFTIVELLIVIVVIGILAAIIIVAYNGIQKRATDMAIKSDINLIAKNSKSSRPLMAAIHTVILN